MPIGAFLEDEVARQLLDHGHGSHRLHALRPVDSLSWVPGVGLDLANLKNVALFVG